MVEQGMNDGCDPDAKDEFQISVPFLFLQGSE
jgi:hypothetical protein